MELNTERLKLREITQQDFQAVHGYASDPETVKYMSFGPNTEEETQEFINRNLKRQQEKLPDIFRNVYALYPKRSKIVHGSEDVILDDKDIRIFRNYLKEAIKIFIHIDVSKELLWNMLDESVYDLAKRERLGQIVSEAVTKW